MLKTGLMSTSPQLSYEQILESVVGQSSFEYESSDNEEDEGQDEKIALNSEAVECFKKCLSWMKRQNNVDTIQIMQLQRMMELSMCTRSSILIQTDFNILGQCKNIFHQF